MPTRLRSNKETSCNQNVVLFNVYEGTLLYMSDTIYLSICYDCAISHKMDSLSPSS